MKGKHSTGCITGSCLCATCALDTYNCCYKNTHLTLKCPIKKCPDYEKEDKEDKDDADT